MRGLRGFFKRLWVSVFDVKGYSAIVDGGLKRAVVYIAIITIIFSFGSTLGPIMEFNRGAKFLSKAIKQVPEFDSGGDMAEGKMPIEVSIDDGTFIIDTRIDEDINYGDKLDGYKIGIYMTNEVAYTKMGENNINIFYLEDIMQTIHKSKASLMRVIGMLRFILILASIILLVGIVILKLIIVLIVCCIAAVINQIFIHETISFKRIFIISIYAVTLPSIILMGLTMLSIAIPFFAGIYLLIALIYVYRAIKYHSISNIEKKPLQLQ